MSRKDNQHKSLKSLLNDIRAGVKGSIGKDVLFYEKVDSTNTVGEALAKKGKADGTVIIADSQEKGRGRFGRSWLSPHGLNIYMSMVLRPGIEPKDTTLITIMASVGCTVALRKVTGLNVTIKWPNDLIVCNKKLGGILTDVRLENKKVKYAVTGIGINVNMDSDTMPDEIKDIATSIKIESGISYSKAEILTEIFNQIDYWYGVLKENRRKELLCEWQLLTSTLGKQVKIITSKETLTGFAESIDNEGMLVLRLPTGSSKVIRSGDLTLLR